MLSLPADFRTEERRLLMAHKFRPFTEAQNDQVRFCDARNRFTSVCIKHVVFHSKRSKRIITDCCVAQAFNYNERDDFSIVASFRVVIPVDMST